VDGRPLSDRFETLLRARQKIGKYRILGRIASGPLADVYRAYDTIQKTRVALKIPKAGDATGADEFLHEVQVATKLQHPNILSVLNASYIDDHFVIAMELGDESLADRIVRRTSTVRALDLAGQAIAALAHAHEHKIIHCDIKPENFILFDDHLRLGDFGISKIAFRTMQASGSGTIGFMAPEQAMGRPSLRSDVFAAGLVLYRMFAGVLPEWPFEWPPRGFDRAQRRLHPDLLALLRRSMRLDPKQRFRDAQHMQDALLAVRARTLAFGRAGSKRKTASKPDWRQLQLRQFVVKLEQDVTGFNPRPCIDIQTHQPTFDVGRQACSSRRSERSAQTQGFNNIAALYCGQFNRWHLGSRERWQ